MVRRWAWCLHCERCFEVSLSREPEAGDYAAGTFGFAEDFEAQFGVERDGQVFAECPYEDCDGSLLDFWWWATLRGKRPELPLTPEADRVYPLYP